MEGRYLKILSVLLIGMMSIQCDPNPAHQPRVHINTHQPRVHINAHQPRSYINARQSRGHINAHQPRGRINAHQSRGHINAHQPRGRINAHQPRVHINAHRPRSYINARQSRGHINAHQDTGHINAHQPRGHINAHHATGHINAHQARGHINVHQPRGHINTHKARGYINTHRRASLHDVPTPEELSPDILKVAEDRHRTRLGKSARFVVNTSVPFSVAPQPVQDTPEVAMAREHFLRTFQRIQEALLAANSHHVDTSVFVDLLKNDFHDHSHDHAHDLSYNHTHDLSNDHTHDLSNDHTHESKSHLDDIHDHVHNHAHDHLHDHAHDHLHDIHDHLHDHAHDHLNDHDHAHDHLRDIHDHLHDHIHDLIHGHLHNHVHDLNLSLPLFAPQPLRKPFPDPELEPEYFLPSVKVDPLLLSRLHPSLPQDAFIQEFRALADDGFGGTCYEFVLLEPENELDDPDAFQDQSYFRWLETILHPGQGQNETESPSRKEQDSEILITVGNEVIRSNSSLRDGKSGGGVQRQNAPAAGGVPPHFRVPGSSFPSLLQRGSRAPFGR
nr:uncharacterized protein LOC123763890 [Procambarus clarkii]